MRPLAVDLSPCRLSPSRVKLFSIVSPGLSVIFGSFVAVIDKSDPPTLLFVVGSGLEE